MLVLVMLLLGILNVTEDAEQHRNCKYHNSNIIFDTFVYMLSFYYLYRFLDLYMNYFCKFINNVLEGKEASFEFIRRWGKLRLFFGALSSEYLVH
jgi:hypothetical protein